MIPCAIIDPRIPEECIKNLKNSGFLTITVPLTELVDTPLSGHPDIQMFIHDRNIFVHPDIDISFLKKIEGYVNIIVCSKKLKKTYPEDVSYNIVCTGNTAFHRKKSTAPEILDYLHRNKIDIINTNQGYSKCSTLIIDENSIITADKSIHSSAINNSLNSLLIGEGYIELPGYKYGFIGGASGKFNDTIYLTGTIKHHPYENKIEQLIRSKGMNLKFLSSRRLFDSGSILFIN